MTRLRQQMTNKRESGASTTEYVIMIVILVLAVGAAAVGYRKRLAAKSTGAQSSVERLKVEALDGEYASASSSHKTIPAAAKQYAGTEAVASPGTAGRSQRNQMAYAVLAVLAVVVVGFVFIARRRKLTDEEDEDDKTPPAGVRAIGPDSTSSEK